jgi:hypothetical protein
MIMLEKLLAEIRSGGTFETGELAARLGTTPELLTAMLEHLQRLGVIQPFITCNDTCAGCDLSNSCRQPQSDNSSRNALHLFTVQFP